MEIGNSLARYVTTERRDAHSNKSGSKCLERWEAPQATPRLGGKIKKPRIYWIFCSGETIRHGEDLKSELAKAGASCLSFGDAELTEVGEATEKNWVPKFSECHWPAPQKACRGEP